MEVFITQGEVISWVAVLVITLFIPALAIFLRTYVAQTKQDRLAKTERHYDLKNTEAYRRAVDTVPEVPLSHYLLSLLFLTVIIFTNAYLLIFGATMHVNDPNFILAGGVVAELKGASLTAYQTKTLLVITMAFLGAYVWSIQTIFRRILTLDLSPGTFQAISVRIIVATLIAVVVRHVYALADGVLDYAVLVILGFGCGVFPQMALGYLRERVKTLWPGETQEAEALPLSLIAGISLFDRVRLAEVGIENAQNLAHANPIEAFIRTPYRLELLMDWIAQAQALIFLTHENYTKLRDKALIRTIFQLHDTLAERDSFNEVVNQLDIAAPLMESLRGTLEKKPAFVRLVELRDRMSGAHQRAEAADAAPCQPTRLVPEALASEPTG